jgi:hypothetical protein
MPVVISRKGFGLEEVLNTSDIKTGDRTLPRNRAETDQTSFAIFVI